MSKLTKYANLAAGALDAIGMVTRSELAKDSARAVLLIGKIFDAYDKGEPVSLDRVKAEIEALTAGISATDAEIDALVAKRKREAGGG